MDPCAPVPLEFEAWEDQMCAVPRITTRGQLDEWFAEKGEAAGW